MGATPPGDMPAQVSKGRAGLISALIALTTFAGAIGAWRATEAGSAAAAAESKALADQRAAAQQEAVIHTVLASNEYVFVRKGTYEALAAALRSQAGSTPDEVAASLIAQAEAYETVAATLQVDPDALDPGGNLDLEAKFDIEWQSAASRQDLDPVPEFADADRLRGRQERIVGITALFVAAALFLTLSRVARTESSRQLFFVGGSAVLGVSLLLLVLQELA